MVISLARREYNIKKENEKKSKIQGKEQRKLEREQKILQNIHNKKSKQKIMEDSETSKDEKQKTMEIPQVMLILLKPRKTSVILNVIVLFLQEIVLVRFLGGKSNTTHYRYICVLQKVFDDGNIEVM